MTNDSTKIWIDLRRNNALTNDPCRLCGARCDPCGLDFFLGETEALAAKLNFLAGEKVFHTTITEHYLNERAGVGEIGN